MRICTGWRRPRHRTDVRPGPVPAPRPLRADMAEFPLRLTLAASLSGNRRHGTLNNDRRTLALASVRSVYHRRPTRPRSPEQMTAGARKVAENEARWGCGGLLTALPCRWLPPPGRAADAEYKPLQLRVAADLGRNVPRTLNGPVSRARSVTTEKKLSGPCSGWRVRGTLASVPRACRGRRACRRDSRCARPGL
ncbi:MvdC/MvdD family ATP grasp protein [Streptomyces platensis]|uniref:MvdC/MvdD family ATP grasp protein n=1 Tax=Streptomyces platensis TaxID=58346 RepID=UPI002E161BD0